jgi:hypothetical protein
MCPISEGFEAGPFRFLLEREFNAQGIAFTDDENKADVIIHCTMRVTCAQPMWAFATVTVRSRDGRVLWRDYFKSNLMDVVADHAAKAILDECQKGWQK